MSYSQLDPGNKYDSSFEVRYINISVMDILLFLKATYKTILVFVVLGVAITIVYLGLTPKKYEAVAQISMAQVGTTNDKAYSPGAIIEESALLIARLSSPSSFTRDEVVICGFGGSPNGAAALAKTIKLAPVKGAPNIVQLKTFGPSPEAAKGCAKSIFDFAQKSQARIIAPYIEEVKIKLADYEGRIKNAKELISRSDKEGLAISATYLSTRDEINYFRNEVSALKNILASTENRATHLVAPIYASDLPISPNKSMLIAVGLLGGLLLGLLAALFQWMIGEKKSLGEEHYDVKL